MYNVRNTYFTLTASVPVAGVLEDFGFYESGGLRLEVVPTAGHTIGSISLVGRIDGTVVAFVGDLLHSPGKVLTLYDLQYSYKDTDGVETAILALNLLEQRSPRLLCPSHGLVMTDPAAAFSPTRDNLRSFFRLQTGGQLALDEMDFTPVASRLLYATQRCSAFYVLLSRNGKRALFVDYAVHYSPGHCDYHLTMFTTMDGKRIAFSGDNVWPPGFIPMLIYRNHVHRTSHQVTARLFQQYRPEILCGGHGLYTNVAPEGYDLFMTNTEKMTELFDKLLPESSGILGLEPSWRSIHTN